LSLCLSEYQHFISKTDAVMITKLDVEMFQDEFLETHLFWVQKVKGRATSDKK